MPAAEPTLDYDYKLTGQDLLYSLCNLFQMMNDPEVILNNGDAICYWCSRNIQPYSIKALTEYMDNCDDWLWNYQVIQTEGSFYTEEFVRECVISDKQWSITQRFEKRFTAVIRRKPVSCTMKAGCVMAIRFLNNTVISRKMRSIYRRSVMITAT